MSNTHTKIGYASLVVCLAVCGVLLYQIRTLQGEMDAQKTENAQLSTRIEQLQENGKALNVAAEDVARSLGEEAQALADEDRIPEALKLLDQADTLNKDIAENIALREFLEEEIVTRGFAEVAELNIQFIDFDTDVTVHSVARGREVENFYGELQPGEEWLAFLVALRDTGGSHHEVHWQEFIQVRNADEQGISHAHVQAVTWDQDPTVNYIWPHERKSMIIPFKVRKTDFPVTVLVNHSEVSSPLFQ